jgi:hypothetical protein
MPSVLAAYRPIDGGHSLSLCQRCAPTAGAEGTGGRDLTTTHGVRARHDQLTNAALAAWFGALRSRDLETKSL